MAKDGNLTAIAVIGGDAPGVVNGTFAQLDTPSMNNRDEVAFVATVRHGRDTFEALYICTATGAYASCWQNTILISAAAFLTSSDCRRSTTEGWWRLR